MTQMSSFGLETPNVESVTVTAGESRYQRVITVISGGREYIFLAENTNFISTEGTNLPGLDLYLTNVNENDCYMLTKSDGNLVFPLTLKITEGLYSGTSLQVYDKGLLVTSVKPFHLDWNNNTKTHTYKFGKYRLTLDIGPIDDFITNIIEEE